MMQIGDVVELEYSLQEGKIRVKREVLIVDEDNYYLYVDTGHLKRTHIDKRFITGFVYKYR